jgi:hypothetical protein
MKTILKPFIAISAAGLLASVAVHACAILRMPNPFGSYAWALHAGIFLVWFPAVIVANRATGPFGYKRGDFWKVALIGCPPWMQLMVRGFFFYAIANFALFFWRTMGLKSKTVDPQILFQGYSGHWMAFYAAALAILYSGTRSVEAKCANGHPASPIAKFCDRCGAAVTTANAGPDGGF